VVDNDALLQSKSFATSEKTDDSKRKQLYWTATLLRQQIRLWIKHQAPKARLGMTLKENILSCGKRVLMSDVYFPLCYECEVSDLDEDLPGKSDVEVVCK
jgi:hypothetical protein